MDENKLVTITQEEYGQLLKDSRFLYALECVGVDNWEGYGLAFDYLEDGEDDDE